MLKNILVFILIFGLDFLLTAGCVWVGCLALGWLSFSVVFSWKTAFAIWILVIIIRFLFKYPNKD